MTTQVAEIKQRWSALFNGVITLSGQLQALSNSLKRKHNSYNVTYHTYNTISV